MSMPERIQRQRTKGWRMPAGAVYVGRPSKWGNPFAVGDYVTRDDALWPYILRTMPGNTAQLPWSRVAIQDHALAVEAHGWWLIEQPHLMLSLSELAGRDLACWCPLNRPCHADVLLELTNIAVIV